MEIKTNAKIRVRLESFDHELLVFSCQKLVNILEIYYDSEVPIFDLLSKADLPSGVFYRLCLS